MAVENVGKSRGFSRDFSKQLWEAALFADSQSCGIFRGLQRDLRTGFIRVSLYFLAEATH